MDKCPFCNNNKLAVIGSNQIGGRYRKTEGNQTTEGMRYYTIQEVICLDCGAVHKSMNQPNLKKYLEDKQFFI